MLKHAIPLTLAVTVVACSTPIERRQANDVAKYSVAKNTEIAAKLEIPQGLKTPTYSKEFNIPNVGAKVDYKLVGERLDIRPPLQVLPMATGTRVEENSDSIKVVIEALNNNQDLKQEIFDVLTAFLTNKQIPVDASDYAAGSIETGWIENEQELESNLWGADKIYKLKQKYRFDVAVRPHGRSGSIAISLLDHEEIFDEKAREIMLTGEDKKRYTIDMLNSAIQYMGLKRQQVLKAQRINDALGIPVSLVNSDVEDTYWSAAAEYKKVWERLRVVLPELGFEIVDLDPNNGLFHVELNDDAGFWSSLWEDTSLPLKEGRYRVVVQEDSNPEVTQILLKNDDDERLSADVVEKIYNKFQELMAEDRNR
ncbi:outer membrane protein assembly factor BamC [Shewanella gelidii]|uniref:Outer membrane protein assembly factor BamC n=1 Tax=Shewanella gelidii TaxID=1642821 RepID=A0A917NCN3_9GAMM|nr:outer membrane protein assembly factor BamC [Shewanella gelidii]MCL1099073.1 outer membrane protein assembly factor BamC [Shewanella gelidii]GGI88384.1 outer membrane protein assembly factor BamC [Shewanella gelidii]